MIRLLLVCLVLLSLPLSGVAQSITRVWETPKKLLVPESVFHDVEDSILYVSNINGAPTQKNGQGFISRVALDGKIQKLKWIGGLNAPKGMGRYKGKLYVTDIDMLVEIDIKAGAIVKRYTAKDARFLNDIAIDTTGVVYVSDMVANVLYRLQGGKLQKWITFADKKGINGLYLKKDVLYVGCNSGILAVDLAAKKYDVSVAVSGGVDGLRPFEKDAFIISDWKGKTQLVAKDKKPIVLLDTTAKKINSADLEYIPAKKLLLIPTFFDNRVVAYEVKPK